MKKITVLLIICTAFLFGCSTSKWVRSQVVESKDIMIALEQHQMEGIIIGQKFGHSYEIALQDLEKILKDLTYIEKTGLFTKEKTISVFQAVEIDRLAPQLAADLAKADNSQRIRFTSYNQGKALIFSTSRETEGVIFVEPAGFLNIAFSLINSEIDPTDTNVYPPGISNIDPLRIRATDTYLIPSAPYAKLSQVENGKTVPMWVIADIEQLKESIITEPLPVEQTPIAEVKKEVPPTVPVPKTRPATSPETKITDTAVEAKVPEQIPVNTLQQDIKNKLKYLKELMEEGLISEKDYNAKKSELLEKID